VSAHTHNGTMPSATTRVVAAGADRLGIAPDRYAHLLGMAPEHLHDDRLRTPTTTAVHLWELVTAHAPWTEVSMMLAEQSDIGTFGVWDYLATSAPTLIDGIGYASTYFAALGDTGTETVEIVEDGEHVTISHGSIGDMTPDAAAAVYAYALGLYHRRLSEAARHRLVPLRVALATRAPRRHDALTELFSTTVLDFEAPVSSMTFLASDLRRSTPYVRPGLSTVLCRHIEQTLAAAVPLRDWLDVFRATLASLHADGAAALGDVARRMAVSARTLQRRLDEQGTTWTEEVERVRREHVTKLLRSTDLSVDAIAARSGYANARSLRRAVHRWHGVTPGALRPSLAASA
jgi:AraC-like DNA-binding protein